jgi:hypothetical protein
MTRTLAIFTLACLFVPSLQGQEAPAKETLKEYVQKQVGRHAYGLYLGKKKAGWEVDEVKLGTHDGKEVAVVTSESYIVLLVEGEKAITQEKSKTCYELEGDGAVVFAEVRTREDDKETVRTAVRKDKGLLLTLQSGKRKTERNVPIPKDTLALQRSLELWLRSTPKKGATFDSYSTAWEEDKIDVKEVYTFKEKKTILWGGVETEVYAVQTLSQGTKFDAELLADGKPLTGKMGALLEIRMEKEAVAKKLDGEPVDLLAATSIVLDKDLGRARNVDKLTLEVHGLEGFTLPESHRQRLVPGKDGSALELRRDFRLDKPVPLTREERDNHVKATATIQSDHEAIRGLAKRVVGDEKDPVKMAGLLEKWVFDNLRKSYSSNADNALTILDNKAGDCTEHTRLFVALARAVDLPAREVGGVAYVKTSKPLFGWHAWAEVHDGAQWVSVDPTWDQVYVDATHIKFSEGSEDFAWVNVAGKLKMKVVSFEAKK